MTRVIPKKRSWKHVASVVVAGLGLLLCAGWLFMAPHRAASSLFTAADANDPVKVAEYVDFRSLKESLKFNLKRYLAPDSKSATNTLHLFGAAMAATVADPVIEAMMTPRFFVLLMTGKRITAAELAASNAAPTRLDETVTTTRYESLDRFIVQVRESEQATAATRLIFERNGWLHWRLTALDFIN